MVVFENPTRQVIITAVGPDNIGLAEPIISYVTKSKGNIAEIQMFNRDEASVFAMMVRTDWPLPQISLEELRLNLKDMGAAKGLSIRAWPLITTKHKAKLALCCTYRPETARATLESIAAGELEAEVSVIIGNRDKCADLAKEHNVPFVMIGDHEGRPNNDLFLSTLDAHGVDYVVLARYMRMVPENVCWSYAGGRIINLHHGILPPYPGPKPYADAYAHHMLTYGATAHFIIPELDEGNQIINQTSFSVDNGTPLKDIIEMGQIQNEPQCLVGALKKVVQGEVALHFNKVVKISNRYE
jgi:formyltetrahydrofolate deformylase